MFLSRRLPGDWGQPRPLEGAGGDRRTSCLKFRQPVSRTHVLLLLIRQQSGHLFPLPFNFCFIIVELADSEP